MTGNYFYKDRAGGQNGPVSFEELVTLIRAGRIAPDCLVWSEGGEGRQAGAIEALAEAFRTSRSSAAPAGAGPLSGAYTGLGLLWRGLVYALGLVFILPAPWAGLWFYNWMASRVALPSGRRLRVESAIGDCWHLFVGMIVAALAPLLFRHSEFHAIARLVFGVAGVFIGYMVLRWFIRSLRSEDGAFDVAFDGGFWPYFGWIVLELLAFFTVIGWAWVAMYRLRWMCRHTNGSHRFEFVASGLQILWRVLVAMLPFFIMGVWVGVAGGIYKSGGSQTSAVVLLVIAVAGGVAVFTALVGWLYNWFVSQIVVTPVTAEVPAAQGAAA